MNKTITQAPQSALSKLAESITPSKTMEIAALASKLRAEGRDIIALSAGELACAPPDSAKHGASQAIADNKSRYTVNTGTIELRQAICDKYSSEVNWKINPSQVIVSSGAKQALYNSLLALCGPGDEVIIFSPYWVSYPEQIRLTGATVTIIETTLEENFQVDPDTLATAITGKTKAVILNSPNNPTGAVYPPETIDRIAEVCAKNGVWLVTDEIYEKIVFAPLKHYSVVESPQADLDRVIMINGFSKTYAMTGWRVGYAIGPEVIIKGAAKIQSHTTSNACSISQSAALSALYADQKGENADFFNSLIPDLLIRRDRALKILNDSAPLRTVTPKGAFYLMLDLSGLFGTTVSGRALNSASDVCRWFLEELEVAITPGEAFGAGRYARVSYSAGLDLVEKACLRIQKGINAL